MTMSRRLAIAVVFSLSALGAAVPSVVSGVEAITYTYDARGRLVKVERAGSVNNNVKTEYEHDKANNRKRVKATGV